MTSTRKALEAALAMDADHATLVALVRAHLARPRRLVAKYTLTYYHKHGEDVSLYATLDAAYKGACGIIIEYWEDITDATVRREIRDLLATRLHATAITRWRQYQETRMVGEGLTIEDAGRVYGRHDLVVTLPEEDKENVEDDDRALD